MKINNEIKNEITVRFQDLAVGDVYEDGEGLICIKTGDDDYGDTPYGKCVAFFGSEWREDEEHRGALVKPIDATITLHGYKTVVERR